MSKVPKSLLDVLGDLSVPHLAEYFGLWCILEDPFRQAVARVNGIDLRAHVTLRQEEIKASERGGPDFSVPRVGNTAVVQLHGTLMKSVGSLSAGTSTVAARRQLRKAMADDTIDSILVHIDSPGGTVSGTGDLADDIAAAAKRKNTVAYIEDLGASAAYWAASQARKVYTGRGGIVGSIGTYMVVVDASQAAEKEGYAVHVVRAGEFKGAGVPGTKITEEQLAEWQRTVDSLNDHFIRGVAAGRKLSLTATRELADGRVWVGAEAVEKKLVDGVQSLDETLAMLQSGSSGRGRTKAMSEANAEHEGQASVAEQRATKAASYDELAAALPKASAEFIVAQLKNKATVEQASKAYVADVEARAEAAEKAQADAEAKAKAAAGKTGVEALGAGKGKGAEGFDGDPQAAIDELVDAKVAAGKARHVAFREVCAARPDLRAALVEAANA